MRAPAKRGRTHRYVGSADRRAIEQRGRLTRQALEDLGNAERDRLHGRCDRRRIGCNCRNAHHGAARLRRSLAAVLMPGVIMRGVAGIDVVLMFFAVLVRDARRMQRLRTVMNMRGTGRREFGHQARRGVAERQRDAGREHAKQIEQGDKPPRFGPRRSRQANEHGGNLMPSADSAKALRGLSHHNCMPNIAAMWLDLGRFAPEVACAVAISSELTRDSDRFSPDSRRAWLRLAVAVLIGSLGSVGMWSVVVALPVVQTEFAASRGTASLAFTMIMLGFGSGAVLTGKITDRYGIVTAIGLGIGILGLGYVVAGMSSSIWQFILVHFAIGLSSSATFGPLMAEASHWFDRYRGLAVAVAASGNYIGGAIWPTLINHGIETMGWRNTHVAIGIFTAVAMTLALIGLRMLMGAGTQRDHENAPPPRVDLRLSTNALTVMLSLAAIACCVAMSMPQVHIVAYCGDLGYGVARGAEMLSLMLGFGIISRIGSGFLADKIGGIRTLLIGSVAQGTALLFYLFFDSLTSLYVISAMFGLFQGGIVPSYAIIVREAMPASEAATRVGIVIFASVFGMSFGGWISGAIFDATGSYAAAFANGLAWNGLNIAIMLLLLMRARQRLAMA